MGRTTESATAFVNKLDADPELQEKVRRCVLAEQHIEAMAKLLGYDFTAEELDAALRARWRDKKGEELLTRVTFSERPGF